METKVALIVAPDATTQRLEFTNDNSLKKFQTAVGGLIQPVTITDDFEMYVNEEGIMLNLEKNTFATVVASEAYNFPEDREYTILGTVVFFGGVDEKGYTKGLTEKSLVMLELMAHITSLKISLASYGVEE
jgi:hypothetical protein